MDTEHIIIERQLINILLNDKESVRTWITSGVDVDRFDPTHDLIVRAVKWGFHEGVILTRSSYQKWVEDYTKSPAEVSAQLTVYNSCHMRVTKKDDLPMLLDRVQRSYVKRKTTEFFQQYAKDRDAQGDLAANRILSQKLNTLENEAKTNKTVYLDIADYKDDYLAELHERKVNPKKKLTCNIKPIDETMGVGFMPGNLTIFCAAPGTYKTTIMMNVGLNIFKDSGESICYWPLEGPHQMFIQKIVSRETRIPGHKLDSGNLTPAETKLVAEEFDKWKNMYRFRILKPGDRCRVSTIRYEIEKRIDYFQPKVMFIDYLDNLIPEVARSRNDLELRDLFEDIIRIGDNYKCHMVTAAKLTRESLKRIRDAKETNRELDTTDVHGGQEFGGNAAHLYGQVKNTAEPTAKLDFFCMKSRYSKQTFSDTNGKQVMKTTLLVNGELGEIKGETDVAPPTGAKDLEAVFADAPDEPWS